MDDAALRAALVRLYVTGYGPRCPLALPAAGAAEDLAALRRRCRAEVRARLVADPGALRVWLAETARELFLSEPALGRGLGLADAADFWGWFDQDLWVGGGAAGGVADRRLALGAPTP